MKRAQITMPFGKHKGQPLNKVPIDYLDWVIKNCFEIRPGLSLAIQEEIAKRIKPSPSLASDLIGEVSQWHREACMRWHPDRPKGNVAVMQAINDLKDRLTQRLTASERKDRGR